MVETTSPESSPIASVRVERTVPSDTTVNVAIPAGA
jgi:hypothetical protein